MTTTSTRRPPRGETIFWGSVLLLIASITGIAALLGTWDWTTAVWVIIAFGALMVIAGLVGGIARAVTRSAASTDRLMPDSTDAPLT